MADANTVARNCGVQEHPERFDRSGLAGSGLSALDLATERSGHTGWLDKADGGGHFKGFSRR